jgi:flagellum-specific peptidoglycan hydrolase FlgJ
MSIFSRLADAEKLSIPQLQMSIKNGTIPAYAGIPLLQEKVKEAQKAKVAQASQQPPIAQEVMQQAEQMQGVQNLPSNLPEQGYNDGGIVAFAHGGATNPEAGSPDDPDGFDQEAYEDQQDEAEYASVIEDRLNAAEQGGSRSDGSRSKASDVNRTPNVEGGIKAPAGDFYKNMYNTLKTKAEEMGFKNPEAIARVGAAQSALETGYGKALAGGNNYFGIKGSGGNKQSTKEYTPERGYYTSNESFRTYKGMDDSAADYLRLMQNPRYAKVAAAETPEEAIAHQGRSGYATSPNYAPSLRAIHSANMAEGGIARLNNGGVAHFYRGGVNDTRSPEDKRIDEIIRNLPDPAKTYPERPKLDINNLVGGFVSEDNSQFMPPVPLTERSKYLKHGATFGLEGAGADNYYPPSAAGSDAARFREQASGAVDAASAPVLTETRTAPKGPTLVADDLYGGAAPSKDFSFANPKTGVDALTDTSAGSSTVDTSSTSAKGEKQKSEYDLIREDIMSQREELKRQKQEDKYMAILQAGLGMMGGTSPNAMANIGQGASMGIAQYGASGKQRAAENAALNKGLLSAQRYKSMDEYQRAALADRAAGRTELAGYRADEKSDRNDLKQAELDARKERDIATMITNGASRVTAELKARFPNPEFAKKGEYESAKSALEAQFIAPYVKMQNNLLKSRYPDVFNETNPVRPAASSNRVQFGSL